MENQFNLNETLDLIVTTSKLLGYNVFKEVYSRDNHDYINYIFTNNEREIDILAASQKGEVVYLNSSFKDVYKYNGQFQKVGNTEWKTSRNNRNHQRVIYYTMKWITE